MILPVILLTVFLHRGDRTIDQMVQAARSGKQNIVEGYAASATSVETELKLVNVAKSSLQELLVDYEDYLRTHGLHRWEKHSRELVCAQQLGRSPKEYREQRTENREQRTENREQRTENSFYDLIGRRVEAITAPGIYIVGGKKVLVK